MKKIETFKKYSLKWKEVAKGLAHAAIVPVGVATQQAIDSGDFTKLNWKTLSMTAIAAGGLYIFRKWIAPPKVVITTHTNAQAENLKENLQ